jgi:D-3-phosphoglycerate dehydrogenase
MPATKWKVLCTTRCMIETIDRYREQIESRGAELIIPTVDQFLTEDELIELLPDVDGVLAGDDEFTERVYAAAPKLRVVSKWGVGIDSIDTEAAARHGVEVRNCRGSMSDAVADMTVGFAVVLARRVLETNRHTRQGEWVKLEGTNVAGKTVGIVGVGSVGSEVARRFTGFRALLLGSDPKGIPDTLQEETGIRPSELDPLLEASDFVTLHCDLNPTSRGLIGPRELDRMKPGAFLINTARGPVVQEAALERALADGSIAGAALDVFEREPLRPDSPLRTMPNVILGCHTAYNSREAVEATTLMTIRNLFDVLEADS